MRGLIYQDLKIYAKVNFSLKKIAVLVLTILFLILTFKKNLIILFQICIPGLMITFVPSQIYIKEKEVNWNNRLRTLPLSVFSIVLSKYISMFIILLLNYSVFSILSYFYLIFNKYNINVLDLIFIGFPLNMLILGFSILSNFCKRDKMNIILSLALCSVFLLSYINFGFDINIGNIFHNTTYKLLFIFFSFIIYSICFFLSILLKTNE